MKQENGQDLPLIREKSDNLNDAEIADSKSCSVCKDLLINIEWFFDMLETARRSFTSDWLTVNEIAAELKISKSIVYRLIRNGELEAINIVDTNGHIAQRGHYRINRADLQKYVSAKRVKISSGLSTHTSRSRQFPKVRNHLGL